MGSELRGVLTLDGGKPGSIGASIIYPYVIGQDVGAFGQVVDEQSCFRVAVFTIEIDTFREKWRR